ncbi:MAG: ATPase, T2SS/T4P/T4SS family [Pirellulales bacterium]
MQLFGHLLRGWRNGQNHSSVQLDSSYQTDGQCHAGRNRRQQALWIPMATGTLLSRILLVILLLGATLSTTAYAQPPNTRAGNAPSQAGQDFASQISTDAIHWPTLVKIVALALFILIWIKSNDWINYSSQLHEIGYRTWNAVNFFPFAVVLLTMFFFPVPFVVRFPVLMVIWLATLIPYIVTYNKGVEPHQTVFTGTWFRHEFASLANKVGVKMSTERLAEYQKGAAVDLIAMGAEDANQDNVNLITARHSPGYLLLKELLATAIDRRAERILLDFTQQAVNSRHEIDGVWHSSDSSDRESGDVMLAVVKTLANLDAKQRRLKQTGQFGAKYEETNYLCQLVCQGTKTGERVILTLVHEHKELATFADLGMREGLQKRWEELMFRDMGFAILSTLPGGGLTTITDISLEETDRLMRDFVSIEEVNHRNREVQNVSVHTYDAAAGQTPDSILPSLIRMYPNVYIIRDLVNKETAKALLNEVRDEHLVITTIPARDAAEALLRLMKDKVPSKDFSALVTAVLYQRMVRKLCPDCKVGYQPTIDLLRKLGIPEGKIQQLYRPPKPEETDKPCLTCNGLGYQGRTGIFELLEITDSMREILTKQPKVELLRKAAKAARQRSLQEEGILLVARGVTSLPELMRVLKQ